MTRVIAFYCLKRTFLYEITVKRIDFGKNLHWKGLKLTNFLPEYWKFGDWKIEAQSLIEARGSEQSKKYKRMRFY